MGNKKFETYSLFAQKNKTILQSVMGSENCEKKIQTTGETENNFKR